MLGVSWPMYVNVQGVFSHWYPPKKLKYVKPRLGVSTLMQIVLDTPNLAQVKFSVLRTFRGGTSKQITLQKGISKRVDKKQHQTTEQDLTCKIEFSPKVLSEIEETAKLKQLEYTS